MFNALLSIFVWLFEKFLLQPPPKIENAKPSPLGSFQGLTATEGRRVPLIWGTVRMKGPNLVWYGNIIQKPIKKKIKTSLFSSQRVVVGYKYYAGMQFALCRGPVDALLRVWIGDKEISTGTVTHDTTFTINQPNLFGGDKLGQGGVTGTLRFFQGSETQTASTYLAQFQKEPPLTGDTPAYRGTCYVAPDASPTYIGNATAIKPWEFELRRIPDGLALGAAATVNGADANLMNVVYELITDTNWGWGLDPAVVDTSKFTAAANTLATEGNGFSYVLDNPTQSSELLKLLEEQMEGVVFFNRATGKWDVNLARADYDINTVPEITAANLKETTSFSRGTWNGTTNEVRVEFIDRADDYKQTYASAQDLANQQLQGGVRVVATQRYVGCMDKTLANTLAWRSLRGFSTPLARATLIVDRSFYAVQPGQVLAYTDPTLGLVKFPVRVTHINYGEAQDNALTLEVAQDIYHYAAGSFNAPPDSGWVEPTDDLQPFDTDKQLAFEAPRALITRDPESTGIVDRVFAAARQQGPEVSFKITERHSSGSPSGAFNEVGEVFSFMLIGTLQSSLAVGSAYPLSTLVITPSPDAQSPLESAFQDGATPQEIGQELLNLIMVDNEFMVTSGAQTSGANVQINGVYRGVLDSVQAAHSAGAKVYLLFEGAGISETTIAAGQNVEVKLLPASTSDEVLAADATAIAFTMSNRVRRPYPPSLIKLDNSSWPASTSLEANGAGPETYAIDLAINRRDYRTVDEVQALSQDAPSIFVDYPTANSTEHQVEVRNDPAGANTLLFTDTFPLAQHDVLRIAILQATDGVLPTRLRFAVRARHTDTSLLTSRYDLVFDFNVTSSLTGQFNLGAIDTNEVSNVYTVAVAGVYNFTLSSAFTAGSVEYRVNAGAWLPLITAGNTTGATAAVIITDTLEFRHTSTDVGALKQLDMNAPGAGQDGYAILFV